MVGLYTKSGGGGIQHRQQLGDSGFIRLCQKTKIIVRIDTGRIRPKRRSGTLQDESPAVATPKQVTHVIYHLDGV